MLLFGMYIAQGAKVGSDKGFQRIPRLLNMIDDVKGKLSIEKDVQDFLKNLENSMIVRISTEQIQ